MSRPQNEWCLREAPVLDCPTRILEVLVVEDEPLIAMSMEQMLGALGHKVVGSFPHVAAALEFLERSRPDVAFLDINLSGESSLALADLCTLKGEPVMPLN
jgi:CheY-like chemotaxis protein